VRDINQEPAFARRLRERAAATRTWLCVGLDPDPRRFPEGIDRNALGAVEFCRQIVAATHDLVAAFKINFAFFEAFGADGWRALHAVRDAIPGDVPVVADAKRGDIPNTATAYAHAIFDVMAFDAVTASPYLGPDSLEPFLGRHGKGVFILCKTSNPGAGFLQDLIVEGEPLYLHLARRLDALSGAADLGFVVGATDAAALAAVRALSPERLILVPGVGAQGARGNEAIACGANEEGRNALVAVSRQILYASPDRDYPAAARGAVERLARELWKDPESPDGDR
jgi:orotidine 5'-phosphate decarboxylase subfamily 2